MRTRTACFLLVVTAGTVLMGVAYAGSDGGGWLAAYPARLAPFASLFFLVAAASLLTGAAGAFLAGSQRPLMLASGGVALSGAALVVIFGNVPSKLAPWLDTPDWLRITLLLVAGAGWGLGWGLTCSATRIRAPLWSLALPFILGGLAVSVLSGSTHCGLAVVWFLALAPAVGNFCWDRLDRFSPDGPGSRLRPPAFVAFGLGTGLLALLALILGLVHLAYAATLIGTLIVLSLLLLSRVGAPIRSAIRQLSAPAHFSPAAAMLAGTLGAVLLSQWIASLGPEIGGDSLGGRVALPVMWLRHGLIYPQREIVLSYMSLGGESLFLLWLPVAGYSVAKIVAFACTLVVTSAIVGRGNWRAKTWALAAAVVFASSTIVWWQFIWGFCDLLQALLMLGAAESLRRWLGREDRRYLFAAGLLAGAATAVKLNGVLAIVAVSTIPVLAALLRRRTPGQAAGAGLQAALPAALILAPAFIRSAILTGNPVFPFANKLFKSPMAPQELTRSHFGLSPGTEVWQAIYKIFVEPGKFVEVGTYHPFLLPLLAGGVLTVFVARRSPRYWLAAFLVATGCWWVTEPNLRYSLYAGLFGVVAVSRATSGLRPNRGALAWTVPSLLMASVVLAGTALDLARPAFWLGDGIDSACLPLRWAVGTETTDAFLRAYEPTYPLAEVLNKTEGEKARVWQMPWLRDHLYFEGTMVSMPHGDLRIMTPLRKLMPDEAGNLGPVQIADILRRNGITHLIMEVDNPWEGNTAESTWSAIYSPAFTQAWLEPLAANQNLRLYRLRETPQETRAGLLGRISLVGGTKSFRVNPGQLYDIHLAGIPAATPAAGYLALVWYSHEGKPLLYQNDPLPQGPAGGWHRWLQSAPPDCTRLDIIVPAGENHPDNEVEVRTLLPDPSAPLPR